MSVREYIGARYVPVFSDPLQWDNTKSYEPLTVVMNLGTSYVSRQSVPAGIAIDNETYWVRWADYNAQLEEYIRQVQTYSASISALNEALPIEDFSDDNTVKDAIDGLEDTIDAINDKFPIQTADISDDAVTSNKIIDNAVTSDKIADDAVTSDKIIDDAVTSDKIADDAVTSDKIADDAVTRDKLSQAVKNELGFFAKRYKGGAMHPTAFSIFRANSHKFDGQTQETRRAQGYCITSDTEYLLLGAGAQNAALYSHTIGAAVFSYVKELPAEHASDMIFIPAINEYWISNGNSGLISRFSTVFNLIGTFTIGDSATLLAYDKATGKVYAHDYYGSIYEVNPTTHETTLVVSQTVENGAKQSIAAHNGVVFILFSGETRIIAYDVTTGEMLDSFYVTEPVVFPLGEAEGIDTDANGDLYISTHVVSNNNSTILSPTYRLCVSGNDEDKIVAEWRSNCIVADRATAFNSAIPPNGTNEYPFATTDEAFLLCERYGQISSIVVNGEHTEEQPNFTFPVFVNGNKVNSVRPKMGRISTTSMLYVNAVNFAPLISVANFISGYRNGPITVADCEKSGSYTTPTSGHDIQSNYPVNKTTTNNTDF